MATKKVNSIEEIHEISEKLTQEYEQKQKVKQRTAKNLDERTRILESQIKILQESHNKLETHYHELVRATVQCFKESAEEE